MNDKVLILGGLEEWLVLYVDRFSESISQPVFCSGFHETVGGTGVGKALNLSRLGFDVTFHCMLGDDDRGKRIEGSLGKQLNLIVDLDPVGTRRQIHIINSNGERLSYFLNHGSLDPTIAMDRLEQCIKESDIIVVNTINYVKRLIPIIKSYGKAIWCDIHDYHESKTYYKEFLEAGDYIQFSSYNMPEYRPFMETWISRGKHLIVCTHAQSGASALTSDGQWVQLPIIDRYIRRDPNGAGDGFFSGVLFGMTKGYQIEACMKFGMVVSGLCVTSQEPAYPELSIPLLMSEYHLSYG